MREKDDENNLCTDAGVSEKELLCKATVQLCVFVGFQLLEFEFCQCLFFKSRDNLLDADLAVTYICREGARRERKRLSKHSYVKWYILYTIVSFA